MLYALGDAKTIAWYEKYGFDSKPGAKDGRIFMNNASEVKKFMEYFESNKLRGVANEI